MNAKWFLAPISLAVFVTATPGLAMSRPLPPEQIAELAKTQFQCELVRAASYRNGEPSASYTPSQKRVLVTQFQPGEVPHKCITVPMDDKSTTFLGYGCIAVSDKTVKTYDASQVDIKEDLGYGSQELSIDLVQGSGTFQFDVTYGWERTHDTGEADFQNCSRVP